MAGKSQNSGSGGGGRSAAYIRTVHRKSRAKQASKSMSDKNHKEIITLLTQILDKLT